jgi:hypothetical protein
MSIRIPVGAVVTKAYYVILPFEGANQAAGQVVGQTETDDFREARGMAIAHFKKSHDRASKTGHVITTAGRPRIVHRFVFEFPEGGGADVELEREMLTNDMIEAAANGY